MESDDYIDYFYIFKIASNDLLVCITQDFLKRENELDSYHCLRIFNCDDRCEESNSLYLIERKLYYSGKVLLYFIVWLAGFLLKVELLIDPWIKKGVYATS